MDSSEGYLARLYRFVRPHVIVYSLPTWEARDVLYLLKANSFGELEIISIVGWLGIILVKGFSFVVLTTVASPCPGCDKGVLGQTQGKELAAIIDTTNERTLHQYNS